MENLTLFDMGNDKAEEVEARRGQIVSSLMKSIRLGREADTIYWMMCLVRGGVDRKYLGRRCFGSSAEDNMSLHAMELGCDLAERPSRVDLSYYQSALASCRGIKWYWPQTKEYSLARCRNWWDEPRDFQQDEDEQIFAIAEAALRDRNLDLLMRAHHEIRLRLRKGLEFVNLVLEFADQRPEPEVHRLATICRKQKWHVATKEFNPMWQLDWAVCRGPIPGSGDPVDLSGLDALIAQAEVRWDKPAIEPCPSWALDGIHTTGDDERFAGTCQGIKNMVAMYERYGRLDPRDKGILLEEGVKTHKKRRKGFWPMLVHSLTRPGLQYEIEPDGDLFRCSCPAFRFRKGAADCKHIRQLLAEHPELSLGG